MEQVRRAESFSLSELAAWFFGLAEKWPDVYDMVDLAQIWKWAYEKSGTIEERVGFLRAGALKRAIKAANGCTACELHCNRLRNRVVFDDGSFENDPFGEHGELESPIGPVHAEMMIVGEGPGNFEQRTGQPFVSFQVLLGSVCARECAVFDNCYSAKSKVPQQPCQAVSLRKTVAGEELLQVRAKRANMETFPIQTAGGKLDAILFQAGEWRESWNPRQLLRTSVDGGREARPGTVYLCNVVKCRSVKPDADGVDGVKDTEPTREQVDACRRWLDLQMYVVQPKVVVLLGNPAIKAVLGMKDPKILSLRGNVFRGPEGRVYLVEVHPAWIIRQDLTVQKEYTQSVVASFKKAREIVAGTFELPWANEATAPVEEPVTVAAPVELAGPPSPLAMEFVPTFASGNPPAAQGSSVAA
jgi:uracil-DNA glycosylase family 4